MRSYFLFLFTVLMSSVSVYAQDTDAIQNELNSIRVRDSGMIIRSDVHSYDPLFLVLADGRSLEVSNNPNATDSVLLNQFKPEWIESIAVLKGKDSTDKYGERGQNGTVLITLKKNILNTMPIEISAKFK